MKRSPEIEKLLGTMVDALERNDVSAVEQMIARDAEVVMIGSDPGEYTRDFERGLEMLRESTPDAAMHIHARLDEIYAYENGDVGWADSTGRFERSGESVAVRMTAVFQRQDGDWRMIQCHASVGVPNDHMFDPMLRAAAAAAAATT